LTTYYIPSAFLLLDCILLTVGLAWICHSLKHEPQVMGNEKWMAVHSLLIFLLFGSQTYAILSKQEIGFKIVIAINCLIIMLMAYIMDKVNRP
jgi:hypothetical protein